MVCPKERFFLCYKNITVLLVRLLGSLRLMPPVQSTLASGKQSSDAVLHQTVNAEVWSRFVEVRSTYKCNTPYAKDSADVHTAI